ncbi:hypothetical protein ACGF3G_40555 [Streptomyces sp. NPDC048179]|uniref:hypothetical protein n=1 Tax=Streptomyces sp. NPDC048179 TaxID=3365506 RepID=UPI00370F9DC5
MTSLLSEVLEAHGGLGRWGRLTRVTATLVSDGELFAAKGLPQDPRPRRMTVDLHEERASVRPFGAPDQQTDFTPGRIAIERADATVVAGRLDPRAAFAGHTRETPWGPLDRAEPWHESPSERRRGLRVTFPEGIVSHSTVQDFHFGDDRLLRRHDYHVDIAGASRPRSTSATSRRRTGSGSRPGAAPTSGGPTDAPTTTT